MSGPNELRPNPPMKSLVQLILKLIAELIGRYIIAFGVGILFMMFNGLVLGKFLSHMGMMAKIMPIDLGVFMLFEVPLWMLCVKIVGIWHRSAWAEIIIAGIIAVLVVQWRTFEHYFWPNFISPTVDPYTKSQMLYWFVFTVTNYILATHMAAIYCWVTWLMNKRKSNASEAIL